MGNAQTHEKKNKKILKKYIQINLTELGRKTGRARDNSLPSLAHADCMKCGKAWRVCARAGSLCYSWVPKGAQGEIRGHMPWHDQWPFEKVREKENKKVERCRKVKG